MKDAIWKGLLLGIGCQIVVLALSVVSLGAAGFIPLMAWSLIQWVLLLPLWWKLKSKALPLAATGVLIIGFLGILLNGICIATLRFG